MIFFLSLKILIPISFLPKNLVIIDSPSDHLLLLRSLYLRRKQGIGAESGVEEQQREEGKRDGDLRTIWDSFIPHELLFPSDPPFDQALGRTCVYLNIPHLLPCDRTAIPSVSAVRANAVQNHILIYQRSRR